MIARSLALYTALAPLSFAALSVAPGSKESLARQALERYLRDADAGHDSTTPVVFEIDASLPKLKKQGIMRGLRVIASAGHVAYTHLQFVGDDLINTAVIARFLKADSQQHASADDVAVTSRRYRFRYTGTSAYNGRTDPRSRDIGLFRGELWLDSETSRPLREWGEFVKSPSVFLRNIYFVRDYDLVGAQSHPRRIIVRMRAALVGPVELTMWLDAAVTPPEQSQEKRSRGESGEAGAHSFRRARLRT